MAMAGLNFIRDATVYEAELSSSDAVTFAEGLTNIWLWIADLIKEAVALELMYEGVQKEFTGILKWVGVEVKEYLDKQSTLDCMAFMDESFANLCNFSDVFNISSSDRGDGHNPSLAANITEGECVFYSTADIPRTSHIWHHCSVGADGTLALCGSAEHSRTVSVEADTEGRPGEDWSKPGVWQRVNLEQGAVPCITKENRIDAIEEGPAEGWTITLLTDVFLTPGPTYTFQVVHSSASTTTTNSGGEEAQYSKSQEDTTGGYDGHIDGAIPAKPFT